MKTLLALILICLFACIKEEVRNWYVTQTFLIWRTKCAPDTIRLHYDVKFKTDNEIIKMQHDSLYGAWRTREQLLYIPRNSYPDPFVPFYQEYEFTDSVWVESSLNADPYVCQ